MLVGAAGEGMTLAYVRDDGEKSELVLSVSECEYVVIPRDRRQLLKLLHEVTEALIAQERRDMRPSA